MILNNNSVSTKIQLHANQRLLLWSENLDWSCGLCAYSGPSLKRHSLREETPLKRTQILGSKYCVCMWCSLSPKHTSVIRTEFFGRKGFPIRGDYTVHTWNPPAISYQNHDCWFSGLVPKIWQIQILAGPMWGVFSCEDLLHIEEFTTAVTNPMYIPVTIVVTVVLLYRPCNTVLVGHGTSTTSKFVPSNMYSETLPFRPPYN